MIDGIPHHLRARTRCLDCRPFRPRRSPERLIPRPAKKLICAACGEAFPAKQFVAGRMRSLYRRKFCLECSSFGSHNTSKEPTGRNPDSAALRRKKRMDSWLRYLRKRRRQRKQKLVELHGGCCEDCGYNKSLAALEFHHRNTETKDFGLGNFNGSWERLLEEAAEPDGARAAMRPAPGTRLARLSAGHPTSHRPSTGPSSRASSGRRRH